MDTCELIGQPRSRPLGRARDYIEVLKPSASFLLTFIGVCVAIIAADGRLSPRFLLIALTIFVASAGANGLTNYLDCSLDARMVRTRHRALASKRIHPPERVLPLNITLVILGLVLAWIYLHPLAFAADMVGTIAAVAWRKKATCVFPQGMLASCAPVLMGWFAIKPAFSWEIVLLCVLIAFWLPLHVWSVMIAHREDYLSAGLTFFPMSWQVKDAVKVLLVFSVVLYAASIALFFTGGFALLYLILANILGILMVYATARLTASSDSKDAWRLYKLSSYPYLGVLFLTMCLDIWL
ncbi:MAG: UbiA family prenyltransferase [Chloroflexi bacterium]|nr:UbiA family prenyltransferase [Chloroflexota bacterium]